MNKRIEELAIEAGYVPVPNAEFANSLNQAFHQKFAELIIQKCCEVANDSETLPSVDIDKYFYGFEE